MKKKLIEDILAALGLELQALIQTSKAALDAAIHEESRSEDSHDTRAIEASYLAGAQAARASELQRMITQLKNLPIRDFTKNDAIGASALVELESTGQRSLVLIIPEGGGRTLAAGGRTVQVITPLSPLGEELIGRRVGEEFEVDTRSGIREYRILTIT